MGGSDSRGPSTGKTFKLTLTDPKVVKALNWMNSWTKTYPVATISAATSAYGTNTNAPLITGQMPMIINGNWMLGVYAQYAKTLPYAVVPVPAPAGRKPTSWCGGFGYTVPKGAKHVAESWKFLEYFCNESNSVEMAAKTTTFPAWLSGLHSKQISGIPHIKTFLDLVPGAHGRPVTPAAQVLWTELTTNATNDALYGKLSPIQALAKAQKKVDAVTKIHFVLYLTNTLHFALLSTIGACISAPVVGYGFSKLEWPGRDALFFATLAQLMLPGQVTLVPLFLLFRHFGWVGTYKPLIIPAYFGSPLFIFLARQFYRQVPNEITEAARIDGAGELRIFAGIVTQIPARPVDAPGFSRGVMTPLILPAIATIALFQFVGAWGDFLRPLIYISRASLYALSIGLTRFQTTYSTDWQWLMAGATLFTIPILFLYFFVQKTFIKGIQFSGLVG